jgi:multidrug efflux pump subunit AcrA (membrane-fusion protein)
MKGWVERLFVDFTGEEVKKGAPLLSIYSPELVSTQEEYLLALKYKKSLGQSTITSIAEGADSLLASTRKRLELWDITPRQIAALERRGTVKKALTLHSPTKGVVTHKMVQEGMYVQPGMNLYTIADISQVWVYADIYEYELPWLSVGQAAEMNLSYLKGKTFQGNITYIYPFLDKKTRTVKVRMEFDNPDWELKPDMYANVKVESRVSDATLVVPVEAVLRSGERDVVIVMKEEGKFLPRNVQIGAEGEGYYQILSGLNEGDRVVTSAQFLIDSESKLKEAINKMLEARQAKMAHGASFRRSSDHDGPDTR